MWQSKINNYLKYIKFDNNNNNKDLQIIKIENRDNTYPLYLRRYLTSLDNLLTLEVI